MNRLTEYAIGLAIVVVGITLVIKSYERGLALSDRPITHDTYVDITDTPVSLKDYHGEYLWLNYAAEWCHDCPKQSGIFASLEKLYGRRMLFITVVTGTDKKGKAPTGATALTWAERFDLPQDRMLAYFSIEELPFHSFYGPDGEVLHHGRGLYSLDKILDIIRKQSTALD